MGLAELPVVDGEEMLVRIKLPDSQALGAYIFGAAVTVGQSLL
jgi:hypothetical protein